MSKEELTASPTGYADWLAELKQRIHAAQQRATLAVNRELVLLYWQIGQDILARQASQGWGSKVVDRLAHDLRNAFPDMKGFSPRNLKYMRAFAEAWPDGEFVQAALAQLPWYHQLALLDKLQTAEERQWYAAQALENGWSRNVLVMQIESGLRQRTGAAITNFSQRLPRPQSDLARESLKDPYRLDFLGLGKEAQERAIEDALVKHVTQFLMELGAGFAFVGRQVHVEVGDKDFYIDLLFYHLKLRCYVVVELKAGEFQPEYAGKLNFYLSAVDSQLRHPSDNPSLGLLLCKNRDKVVAEYALRDMNKPIGVAEYQLVQALPKELQTDLPRIEDIESELRDADDAPGEAQA
ncbi:PDDEXK nuclease domain-containing protein [Cupriavidus cauae]|uniref:PDDEXK nuclease domain-containing protein n=1 Tax=Cupriavidus cauae TaxID=2608999 RepID=UPI0022432F6A|nr:PDDEXK nuclease domain-containing protein [Cupriavidus cauae]UZN49409.1 PDDEXK nuclease domain-containing protein [Cupriavidus cauae]